jgi:hypothetical protein
VGQGGEDRAAYLAPGLDSDIRALRGFRAAPGDVLLFHSGSRCDRRDAGKKGWEFVHVCVDDATRLAYVEVLSDETATTAVGFLRRALAFYTAYGITVERA